MPSKSTLSAKPLPTVRRIAALADAGNGQVAKAVDLVYVTDSAKGIQRIRSGEGFVYRSGDEKVKDQATLDRIKSLAVPPAWEEVWICAKANGHLQATGKDVKGRKQYRYHPRWSHVRGLTKFYHLGELGRRLPVMRKRIEHDLGLPGIPKEKVLAAAVRVMEDTHIRVGNALYAKENSSYGLSTLKDRHVKKRSDGLHLHFKGKSGVEHDLPLHGRKLVRLVMRCKELPGQDLFQFRDEQGEVHAIDSGMVNAYIAEISGGGFTSKDLRTWMGSVHGLRALLEIGEAETDTACKHNINLALDNVAKHLGNTRSVCRKYYVHPAVLSLYSEKRLAQLAAGVRKRPSDGSREESILLKLLTRVSK